ncbi:Os03g0290400, partial [Oryza sativa Japonica Group]
EYIADDIKIDDEARPAPASTPRSLFSKKTKTGSAAISGNSKYINVLFFSNFLKKRYSSSDCNVNCLLETEREKLFDGSSDVEKPRMKSTQEILTKYKFGGDAAAAAAHAKDKLKERGEKLARISQESAELQNESENFASLAHQIAKSMENKKWWKP